MPIDGQKQTDRVDFAGQLRPQVALDKVDFAVDLILEHARFESPIFARADPDKLMPIGLSARNGGQHPLDPDATGEVLRQPQRRGVERVGRSVGRGA